MAELDIPAGDRVLYMAFDDNEEPVGLLLDHSSGMYVRDKGHWKALGPRNPYYSDVEIVKVTDDFLAYFDKLDGKNSDPSYEDTQSYAVGESTDE